MIRTELSYEGWSMVLDLCHSKFLKESNQELYASD